MSWAHEFREFAVKGNVVDLAVGVIIGAAFGKIVDSAVSDLVMPVVNAALGGKLNFENLYWVLAGNVPAGAALADARKAGVVFAWGNFLTIAINFAILTLVVFWMVRSINRLRRADAVAPVAPAEPPPPAEDVLLLREIRDALRK